MRRGLLLFAVLSLVACASDGPPKAQPADFAKSVCGASGTFADAMEAFGRVTVVQPADGTVEALRPVLEQIRDLTSAANEAATAYGAAINDQPLPDGEEYASFQSALVRIIDDLRSAFSRARANFDVEISELNPGTAAQMKQNVDEAGVELRAAAEHLGQTLKASLDGPLAGSSCESVAERLS